MKPKKMTRRHRLAVGLWLLGSVVIVLFWTVKGPSIAPNSVGHGTSSMSRYTFGVDSAVSDRLGWPPYSQLCFGFDVTWVSVAEVFDGYTIFQRASATMYAEQADGTGKRRSRRLTDAETDRVLRDHASECLGSYLTYRKEDGTDPRPPLWEGPNWAVAPMMERGVKTLTESAIVWPNVWATIRLLLTHWWSFGSGLALFVIGLLIWSLPARAKPGCCPHCGYDLRATPPDKPCPECGNAPTTIIGGPHA
jgi:hypothetical protein